MVGMYRERKTGLEECHRKQALRACIECIFYYPLFFFLNKLHGDILWICCMHVICSLATPAKAAFQLYHSHQRSKPFCGTC